MSGIRSLVRALEHGDSAVSLPRLFAHLEIVESDFRVLDNKARLAIVAGRDFDDCALADKEATAEDMKADMRAVIERRLGLTRAQISHLYS